jgi:hypothetical protein
MAAQDGRAWNLSGSHDLSDANILQTGRHVLVLRFAMPPILNRRLGRVQEAPQSAGAQQHFVVATDLRRYAVGHKQLAPQRAAPS